jgi:integrase
MSRFIVPSFFVPGFLTIQQPISSQRKTHIGWHTFRHTFGMILNANGGNPKVIQELMRNANLKVTMDTYVQL